MLRGVCRQGGTLLQLLSNRLTGHSIACYRDDVAVVRTRLMQAGGLSSEPLSTQDILRLMDASNGGAAWVEVMESSPPPPPAAAAAPVSAAPTLE